MTIEIPIQCPKCGHTIKKRLTELQTKKTITCRCGTRITIDPTGFKSAVKNRVDFKKALSKFGK